MCVENTFEKGAVGALHHHPHTQITYVVSGAFDFTVDGVTHTVRAGDTILKEDGVTVCVMVLHPSDGRWRNRRERCSSGHRFQLDLAIRWNL